MPSTPLSITDRHSAGVTPDEFRPVPGYEGRYEVNCIGTVRSLRKSGTRIMTQIPRERSGHLFVTLSSGGAWKKVMVHRIVASAFVGPATGPVCRHLDGNPTNNHYTNLAWGSVADNNWDMVRHGRHVQASKTHCPHGHEYSTENTYRSPQGKRHCRICGRAAQQRYKEAQR